MYIGNSSRLCGNVKNLQFHLDYTIHGGEAQRILYFVREKLFSICNISGAHLHLIAYINYFKHIFFQFQKRFEMKYYISPQMNCNL